MEDTSQKNNPLHGLTLEKIITDLVNSIGWEEFTINPSIQSSLKFLRKTPWARTKVESFYLYAKRKKMLKE